MRLGWAAALAGIVGLGCTGAGPEGRPPAETSEPPVNTRLADPPLPTEPERIDPEPDAGPVADPPVFQPAFHQALRWSETVSSLSTFQLRAPVGRGGDRLRIVLRSGDGALTVQRASVTREGGAPVAITFGGGAGASLGARQAAVSDPLEYAVSVGDELLVRFEVEGALAASAIDAFPGSAVRGGAHALATEFNGAPWTRGVGLTTIEVEGPRRSALVAIGDSITEGFVSGRDDYRLAWPAILQTELGLPVANAAVSGQGIEGVLINLDPEILALSNLTDCVLLIGTNDLQGNEASWLIAKLGALTTRLEPHCRVWMGTLLPKERVSSGDLEQVKLRRFEVNAWIRAQTSFAGVVDFEAFTRTPEDVHQFREGLDEDGVHPSVAGQRVMGLEAAKFLAPLLDSGADPTQ